MHMFPYRHKDRSVSRFEYHANSEGALITEYSYMLSGSNVFIRILNNDKYTTNHSLSVHERKINYPSIKGLGMRTEDE
jgi:hypothetical protein